MLCRPNFVSPFYVVHFADDKLENAKNDEENGISVLTILSRAWGKVK